jgi:hypothetical protein
LYYIFSDIPPRVVQIFISWNSFLKAHTNVSFIKRSSVVGNGTSLEATA